MRETPPRKFRETFLVFGAPAIKEAEVQEVVETLRSGWLGTGPKVGSFENNFREYIGSQNAVALNSCTAALNLAFLAAGIGEGDEVITTPMTFCASANAIIHVGAQPVFVDIKSDSMNIDPTKIERAITSKTKAILPVHFAGRPCEMDRIMEIARRHNLVVIEDAAHCIEGGYKGKKIGTIGDLTCFSFYVTKNLTTGEGGMITTNNGDWANEIKIMALHGMTKDAWNRYSDEGYKHYQVIYPGFKYNMMDIQAAIGLHQLKRINENLKRREHIWKSYDEAFADLPVFLPSQVEPDTIHARHLYTLLLDIDRFSITRDDFMQALYQMNIGTGIHYVSLHLHDYYRNTYGFKPDDYPVSKFISERTVSLPLSAKLTDQDVDDVIRSVRYLLKDSG